MIGIPSRDSELVCDHRSRIPHRHFIQQRQQCRFDITSINDLRGGPIQQQNDFTFHAPIGNAGSDFSRGAPHDFFEFLGQLPAQDRKTIRVNFAQNSQRLLNAPGTFEASRKADRKTVADGIVAAAREIAETTNIQAICAHTQSGTTVSLVARERPRTPIIAMSPIERVLRRLCLTWGTHCVLTEPLSRFREAVISAARAAREFGFAEEDQQIVITAGVPFNIAGTTNILRVATCDERLLNRADPE